MRGGIEQFTRTIRAREKAYGFTFADTDGEILLKLGKGMFTKTGSSKLKIPYSEVGSPEVVDKAKAYRDALRIVSKGRRI